MVPRAPGRPPGQNISVPSFLIDDLNFINTDSFLLTGHPQSEVIPPPHPMGCLLMSGYFSRHDWEGCFYWHLGGRGQVATKHSTTRWIVSTTKNYPAPDVNSTEIEKSCFGLSTVCPLVSIWRHLRVQRMRRQATDWEKIFAKNTSGKGLWSKIYKEKKDLNNRKANNLTKKWAKDVNAHLTKEDILTANMHKGGCAASPLVCCLVIQSCPTLCDPIDCSPVGSSVHGIFQARVLEWVAISFSMGLPTQGFKPHLCNWQVDSLPLSHQGSPVTRELQIKRTMEY